MTDEAPNQTQGEYGRLYAMARKHGLELEPKSEIVGVYWLHFGGSWREGASVSSSVAVRPIDMGYRLTVLKEDAKGYALAELVQHYTCPANPDEAFEMLLLEAKHQLTLKDVVARLTGEG